MSVPNCNAREQMMKIHLGGAVHFSTIEGGYATGTGNIDADPLFVNAAVHNFALKHTSPCVDAGADVGVTNDCIGAKRPMNSGYDMGAYEMDPAPIQVVTPTLLDFGDVSVGDTAYHLVNVASTGNGTLIGTVEIVLVPIFSATPASYVIPPFSATNVTVAFKPLAEFAWTANVVFASNGGTQHVVAIGTGIPEPAMLALLLAILPALRRRASRSWRGWIAKHGGGSGSTVFACRTGFCYNKERAGARA